jgi:hypothetical protein
VQTIDEVRRAVSTLQDDLSNAGHEPAALRLRQSITDFYTTSTEALMGIADAIEETRESWSVTLPSSRRREVDSLLKDIKQMMNLA